MEKGHARSLAGLQMRIEKVMDVAIAREIEHMERRLLVLATVGSAGPFIGLFGTIWGIMTSFQSIAASKNTSLAVVAPGIAEALFATAIGLIAAIPTTIFYNKFQTEVNPRRNALKVLPTNSRRSCRGRSTSARKGRTGKGRTGKGRTGKGRTGKGRNMAAPVVSAASTGRHKRRRHAPARAL